VAARWRIHIQLPKEHALQFRRKEWRLPLAVGMARNEHQSMLASLVYPTETSNAPLARCRVIDHRPIGQTDTCERCDKPRSQHRVGHRMQGAEVCTLCGLGPGSHRPVEYLDRQNEKKSERKLHRMRGNEVCTLCGLGKSAHRNDEYIERRNSRKTHRMQGDPCTLCGLGKAQHRSDSYVRKKGQRSAETRLSKYKMFIGIDGEGVDEDVKAQGGVHKYTYLGAATEDGEHTWGVEDFANGLRTQVCLDFILDLPKHARIFAYSFNYDLTKMLEDLPDEALYLLFRPELRQRLGEDASKGPKPVLWDSPTGQLYALNLQGTKFSVRRIVRGQGRARSVSRVVWDVFKFFQGKFVSAIKDWKVGEEKLWKRMQRMKDKRGEFNKESPEEIKTYCLEECVCMAQLARKLTIAHEAAGLKLKSYYGAGSSGAAMLDTMSIKEQVVPTPEFIAEAVAQSFFGGRFENSVVGRVDGTIWNYDISSAYPYQTYFLPCLQHGTWRLTQDEQDIHNARAALVHYGFNPKVRMIRPPWGPFPFREKDSSISYPISSGGGYVWRDEFLAGQRTFANVRFHDAYILESDCDCHPFAKIAHYYSERCRIGKEGPGIVLKLGVNSCYGKLAQSVGRGVYNCWIWASMITSGTRAQILDLLALHRDRRNLLMIATDGIFTRERLTCPVSRETGTGGTGKPLGGWEEKKIEQGVFIARPGIYFPMNPTEEQIKDVRGRGVGKGVVLDQWRKIVQHFETHGLEEPMTVANVKRFCGGRTSTSRRSIGDRWEYSRAWGRDGAPAYGQWVSREVALTFFPMPKRSRVNNDNTLEIRKFPLSQMSAAYDKAVRSADALEIEQAREDMIEQPDLDLIAEGW
jgi:DNA polymerase type B, organellar and viral